MDSPLNQEVFAGFTVLHIAIAVVGVIVLLIVLKLLLNKPKEMGSYMSVNTCDSCGWSGEVSRYNRVCKQCGSKM